MVNALKNTGNFENTPIVITAKHGQAPIDPNCFFPTGRNSGYTTPADLIANLLPTSESPAGSGIGPTQDDVSLLWLKNAADTTSAVATLEKNGTAIGLGSISYGPTLALNYNTAGLPAYGDPRTTDLIVTPNPGVVYTGSSRKLSEHGGFSPDDTNVVMLFAKSSFTPRTVSAAAETTHFLREEKREPVI